MLIAIQVAINPKEPGWEAGLKAAAQAVWKATGTDSKAILAYSTEAVPVVSQVAMELDAGVVLARQQGFIRK